MSRRAARREARREERYRVRLREAQGAYHASRCEEREVERARWAAFDEEMSPLQETLNEWKADDNAFTSAVRQLERERRAWHAAQDERDRQVEARSKAADTDRATADTGASTIRPCNPWTEELYLPLLRDPPDLDLRRMPYRLFEEEVHRSATRLPAMIAVLLECCLDNGGEAAGFDYYIACGDLAQLFVTRFYSELEHSQVHYVLENVITRGKPYITFDELEDLVSCTLLGPAERVNTVYTCFLKLICAENMQKFLNSAGGFKNAEVTKRKRGSLIGFDGPEMCTSKDVEKVLRGETLANGAKRSQLMTQFLKAAEGTSLPSTAERPINPADFAKVVLCDAGMFGLFFGTMFDAAFHSYVPALD